MTILITTIPDEPREWAGWLEQHLVGLRLRDLVAEFRLLPGTVAKPLNELLDRDSLTALRSEGLSALSADQLRTLFNAPDSLLELQEDVLLHGGDYWTTISPQAEMRQAIERVGVKLKFEKRQAGSLPHSGAGFQPAVNRRFLFVLATTAAMLLIGLTLWQRQPAGSGSMLGRPGLLASDVTSSSEYLNRIADAGNEWFEQQPQDSTQLMAMLQNVSHDCQILIDADHKPLTPAEREWFVTKCTNWKKAFDATLTSLQSGSKTFDDARSEADATMTKLVNVLRAGPTA
ncbi:MAG: hypothetical protein R3C17_18010 [Planctomycetaceae bacterium]